MAVMEKFAVLPVAFACDKKAEITVGMMIMIMHALTAHQT